MRVFLSHSSADESMAWRIREIFEAAGIEVWSPPADRVGSQVGEVIADGIQSADAVVVLMGREAATHQWPMMEVAAAVASNKRILPVLADEAAEIPFLLRDRVYLDLSVPERESYDLQRLVEALLAPPPDIDSQGLRDQETMVALSLDAVRREADAYRATLVAQRRRESYVRVVVATVATVAAGAGLFSSAVGQAPVALLIGGLSAAAAQAAGYWLGRRAPRVSDRGTQQGEAESPR